VSKRIERETRQRLWVLMVGVLGDLLHVVVRWYAGLYEDYCSREFSHSRVQQTASERITAGHTRNNANV